MQDIHPTAIIDPSATIEENVSIGAFTLIGPNVFIGEGTVIEARCELGMHKGVSDGGLLSIGAKSVIRSGSVFYENSTFGNGLTTGHRVTVREDTYAGEGLQLGTLCDIQGHCHFGKYVKLHSNVHIGQHTVVEDYVWIFPYVVCTNDPHPPSEVRKGCHICSYAVIGTMSTILPDVTVGRGALVGAMSLVRYDVHEDMICVGVPGKEIGPTSKIKHLETGQPSYPWRSHFHRGYPEDIVSQWIEEFSNKP